MGTPIEFDEIRVGDRIVITEVQSGLGEDSVTLQYTGFVKSVSTNTGRGSDWIKTEGYHVSRYVSDIRSRTYELISRPEPKVGDVAHESASLPLGTVTVEQDGSGPYFRTEKGWQNTSGRTFPNADHVNGTVITYLHPAS